MKQKQLLKKILSKTGLLRFAKMLQMGALSADSISNYIHKNEPESDHTVVHDFAGYQRYLKEYENRIDARHSIENAILSKHPSSFLIKGKDSVSGKPTELYKIDKLGLECNLRESCVGLSSKLNSRIRATLLAIQHSYDTTKLHQSDVYLTEAVTDLYGWFEGKTNTLTGSEYLGQNLKSGAFQNGIMHQDITDLSFADNTFDIGVCLEVLEHVPDYKKGFNELARVTRKGGSMFISVPFLENAEKTLIRASIGANGELIHHLEPEYHGDPVNANGGILCFQHFGWDIVTDLTNAGFSAVRVHFIWSAKYLILGRHMIIFEAIK